MGKEDYICGDVAYTAIRPNETTYPLKCNLAGSCGETTGIYAIGPKNIEDINHDRIMFFFCKHCQNVWYLKAEVYKKIVEGMDGRPSTTITNLDQTTALQYATEFVISEPPKTTYTLAVSRFKIIDGTHRWVVAAENFVYNHGKKVWNKISVANLRSRFLPTRLIKNCGYELQVEAILQSYVLGNSIERLLRKETK